MPTNQPENPSIQAPAPATTTTATARPPNTAPPVPPTETNAQEVFEYNDKQLTILVRSLSTDRLAPYFAQARSDRWVAIHLYERNTKLSEALYGVVQALEVLLRNSIHSRLSQDIGADDWYEKVPLLADERDEIERAKRAIADRSAPVTPGRIVAELNFGFWVRMFSGQYEKELWVKYLRKTYAASMQRKTLHDRIVQIKTLRNRIAHHETLIRRDLPKDYRETLEAIGWISPTVRAWVKSTNCFESRFAERIPKRPKEQALAPPENPPTQAQAD